MTTHITTREAAARLGCTRQHIHYLLKNGKLRGSQEPGFREWKIERDSVEERYVDTHEAPQG